MTGGTETEGFEPGTTQPSPHQQETGSTPQGVTQWRKRPVIVSAIQWTGENAGELRAFAGSYFETVAVEDRAEDPDKTAQVFDVLHCTWVTVYNDQWVIKGLHGEFYPCDPAVFEQTYEPAAEVTR